MSNKIVIVVSAMLFLGLKNYLIAQNAGQVKALFKVSPQKKGLVTELQSEKDSYEVLELDTIALKQILRSPEDQFTLEIPDSKGSGHLLLEISKVDIFKSGFQFRLGSKRPLPAITVGSHFQGK